MSPARFQSTTHLVVAVLTWPCSLCQDYGGGGTGSGDAFGQNAGDPGYGGGSSTDYGGGADVSGGGYGGGGASLSR